ncbi:MAG TPA: hypothetical protein VJL87_04715 [Bdellovibrionota bacterium]|nr:hypothetical protein [Bdellovibrionota bacterium]
MNRGLNFTLGLVAILVGISGCATKVVGLKKSPSFLYSNVQNGKMAIGGVVSATEEVKPAQVATYGNMLMNQIIEERSGIGVASTAMVKEKIGSKQYDALLNDYKNFGSLSKEQIKSLSRNLSGVRYVVFARIDRNEVTNDRAESAVTNSDGKEDPNKRKITKYAGRAMSATFQVADLVEQDSAWSGSITKSSSNSKEYTKTEFGNSILGIVVAIANKGGGDEDTTYPYPTPPDEGQVLNYIFSGFAENLPKED